MPSCQTGHQLEVQEQYQDADLVRPIPGSESDGEFLMQDGLRYSQ